MSDAAKIAAAIDLAIQYGQCEGERHKAWVIDQMVRMLAGESYEQVVKDATNGEDGPETNDWDVGMPP